MNTNRDQQEQEHERELQEKLTALLDFTEIYESLERAEQIVESEKSKWRTES